MEKLYFRLEKAVISYCTCYSLAVFATSCCYSMRCLAVQFIVWKWKGLADRVSDRFVQLNFPLLLARRPVPVVALTIPALLSSLPRRYLQKAVCMKKRTHIQTQVSLLSLNMYQYLVQAELKSKCLEYKKIHIKGFYVF